MELLIESTWRYLAVTLVGFVSYWVISLKNELTTRIQKLEKENGEMFVLMAEIRGDLKAMNKEIHSLAESVSLYKKDKHDLNNKYHSSINATSILNEALDKALKIIDNAPSKKGS